MTLFEKKRSKQRSETQIEYYIPFLKQSSRRSYSNANESRSNPIDYENPLSTRYVQYYCV